MRALRAWRRFYGENPMHLLALLGCFALVGAVVLMVRPDPSAPWMLVWFLGAVVAHDLALYPLYALADRTVVLGRWARRRFVRDREPRVPAVNHVRLPAMASVLLLLIYLPSITRHGEGAYFLAAGLTMEPYLERWLAVTAALFLGSATVYAIRLGRATVRAARRDAT